MLGHVSIRVSDLNASVNFYLSILAPLSYQPMRFPKVIGLGSAKSSSPIPDFWLRQYTPGAENNHSERPTPIHISFYVNERKQVDEFHARGLDAGGKDNGLPGLRPFMDNYYGIYSCTLIISFLDSALPVQERLYRAMTANYVGKSRIYFGLGRK